MTTQNNSHATAWQRIRSLWHRTDRARALAQIPIVAASHGGGPVASQVRLASPANPPAIRRDAEAELQKQWADHEIRRLENNAAYVIRNDPSSTRKQVAREHPTHEQDR